MKKPSLTLAAAAIFGASALPGLAYADLAGNVGVVSDYRYRGISQTRFKPALQGGVDYSHASGLYLGAWASTIKWVKDAYGDARVEIDLYGGYKGEVAKDVGFDVGVLQYVYPGARTTQWDALYKNPNTTEVYGALIFGPVTAKVSYALTNLFGNYDFARSQKSNGSYYVDVNGTFEVGPVVLAPHIGYQKVRHIADASYTDWSLTVSKEFKDVTPGVSVVPSLAVVGTDASKSFYVPGGAANSTKFLGRTAVIAGLKVTF